MPFLRHLETHPIAQQKRLISLAVVPKVASWIAMRRPVRVEIGRIQCA
jgi:hypothetical protein